MSRDINAMIDTESDPGSWAEAIAHSPCLRIEEFDVEQPGTPHNEQSAL